ncbi:MAG: PQQ-dependent sugar dehydrogenase, partial [Dongiaceae bacterium]
AYIGANPDPDYGSKRPELVARTKAPDVLFRSHSAPLGLTFYDGEQFPADYRGDAFIGMQGSWNAAKPEGYMVARVPFENGKPKGYYEVFASGFWLSGGDKARVWGRPIGVAVAKDGSLLVADETGLVVWRIAYGR